MSFDQDPLASSSATLPRPTAPEAPPPPLLRRVLLLCLQPEQWALAARYPTRITVASLAATILLASLLIVSVLAVRSYRLAHEFLAHYDQKYPLLVYQDGLLSLDAMTAGRPPVKITQPEFIFSLDPQGRTKPENLTQLAFVVIDARQCTVRMANWQSTCPITDLLGPADPKAQRVDAARIERFIESNIPFLAAMGLGVFLQCLLINSLWALTIAFLTLPLVKLGIAPMSIPGPVAYRITLAISAPLIMLGALIDVMEISPLRRVGVEWNSIGWFALAGSLALWAGFLAFGLFQPTPRPRNS